MKFLLLLSPLLLVDSRETLRRRRNTGDPYGPTPPEEKRTFMEKWKDFDQTLALRREQLLKQLREKALNVSPPGIKPGPPAIHRDSYQSVIEEGEQPNEKSTTILSELVEAPTSDSTSIIPTELNASELRELNEMKETEFVPTTTESNDEEDDCSNLNEGSGTQLALNVEDEAFLNRAVEKISGEVRTRRPCIDHEDLKQVRPMKTEFSIEAGIEEVPKPANFTKIQSVAEIQSGESSTETTTPAEISSTNSIGYGLNENISSPDELTAILENGGTQVDLGVEADNISDILNLNISPDGSILKKKDLNLTNFAAESSLTMENRDSGSKISKGIERTTGYETDSSAVLNSESIENLIGNVANVFHGDGVFEVLKENWTAPTKGAVIGCPPPKLCAKNCFVTINDKGCQDCQCLWISLACENDNDCPEEAQSCEMGKCQCRLGWEQDMKKTGFCRGAFPRATRVADPTAKFKSQHRSLGSPMRKVEVAKRFIDSRANPTKLTKMRDQEQLEFTTLIPASVYFFGRPVRRSKRDTLSRENLDSSEKPRQNERLEWPGPCDDNNKCPEDLFCIQGDCWSLPDKPLKPFTTHSDFEDRKMDFPSLSSRGLDHFGLQGFPDFSNEANHAPSSLSGNLPNKRPNALPIKPIAKPRPKKISPPGFSPTSEEELVISSPSKISPGQDKNVKMIEIRSRSSQRGSERRRAPTKTATSPAPDFIFSAPTTTVHTSKEPPSFAINDAGNHDDFMQEFWKQKLHLEAPNKFHELEEEVTAAASLDDSEDHEVGVWYEMKPGEFLRNQPRPHPSADVPKRTDRMFYEYTKNNLLNKPILILAENAKGKVVDECSKDSDCSLRTKCCLKKWCDRSEECGDARFCLPDCTLTKMVHPDDGKRPQMDLIYD